MNVNRSAAAFAVATLAVALIGWMNRDRLGASQRSQDTGKGEPTSALTSGSVTRRESPRDVLTTHAMAALAQRVHSLEQQRAEPAPQEVDVTPTPDYAALEAKRAEEFRLIDQAFREESRDHSWAPQQTKVLTQLFEQGGFLQSELTDVDCRTTFCRMRVRHSGPAGARSFEQIAAKAPGNTYGHVTEQDGVQETVVFFIRPGQEHDHVVYQTLAAVNE